MMMFNRLLLFIPYSIALVTERVIEVLPGGPSFKIQEFFFESPVAQPRQRSRRVADLTGLKIWPTAVPLLKYIAQQNVVLPSTRIVELGSGVGVVGIGLAALGAQVLLTDPDLPVALSESEESTTCTLLQANIDRNAHLLDNRARVARLVWGNDQDANNAKPLDIVIASDVLYNPDYYKDLAHSIQYLDAPAIIAYQPRLPAHKETTFFDLLQPDFQLDYSGPIPDSPCQVYHLQPRKRKR